MRVVALALAAISTLSVLAGCAASPFRPHNRLVPGPSGAIALAVLARSRVAVLAGNSSTKAIFVIDLATGEVLKSFGVTKEATGVTAEGAEGPLLVSVGATDNGKSVGAVERWSLAGSKAQVVALPAAAQWITRAYDGAAYVLIANGNARVALPVSLPSMKIGRPILLDANVNAIELCRIGSTPFLLYAGGKGAVVMEDLDSGIVQRSSVIADHPSCLSDRSEVFGITRSFAAAGVAVVTLPGLLQAAIIPASNDAVALYESEDHHLLALNATTRTSNIETFPDDALGVKTAAQ